MVEALNKQVAAMLEEFPKSLAPGVDPPSSLAKLEEMYKAKDVQAMYLGIYEVTIEGEFMYQVNEETKKLEPLGELDWTNLEDETVKAKMSYLYSMGIRMLGNASPEMQERIKQLVLDKLVGRVGLEDGKAFDDWLL